MVLSNGICPTVQKKPDGINDNRRQSILTGHCIKKGKGGSVEILPTTHFSAIARMTPSLSRRGRQPRGASPPLDPQFRSFFRCVFTTVLHGTRVDRHRAPVWFHHYPILSLTGFLQSRKGISCQDLFHVFIMNHNCCCENEP